MRTTLVNPLNTNNYTPDTPICDMGVNTPASLRRAITMYQVDILEYANEPELASDLYRRAIMMGMI